MFYNYVLFCFKDKTLYKGYTNNLRNRFVDHQKGLVQSTRDKRPLELIYYEAYCNKRGAQAREKFFKTGWGRNYLKSILKNYLEEKKIISKNLGRRKVRTLKPAYCGKKAAVGNAHPCPSFWILAGFIYGNYI